MTRIVIVGNSAAGFSCCSALTKFPLDTEITVISQEDGLAYKRNLLIDYLAGNVNESELFLTTGDFYEKNKVKFLRNSKVVKVDIKKQTVVLKDNSKINYDYLVIASGQKANIPDLPGKTKDGVFAVYELEDIKKVRERLLFSSAVCIVGEPKLCLRLSEVIAKKDKEVKIISKPRPDSFIQTPKTEWIDTFELTELIGEGAELKAFKLNNGKAIATSLVLFVGNYRPATEFLKETGIKENQGYVIVDDAMRTNFENVFACGSVCKNENYPQKEKSWEDGVKEGELVAAGIVDFLERGKTICQQTY